MSRLISFWRNLLFRRRVDRALDDEVRATFDLLVDERLAAGATLDEARRAAALALGGPEAVKQQVREARAGAGLDSLLRDVRYACRGLRRAPVFMAAGLLSLGLGLAGSAVVFSLADAYLFRSRPGIADPARLAEVGRSDAGEGSGEYRGDGFDTFSYPAYLDVRERQTTFQSLAAYKGNAVFGLGGSATAQRVSGAYVSANFFDVLGARFALGRGFRPEEERLGDPRAVAVISHRLWRSAFNGDAGIIGRAIRLNGRPFTVIGVTAERFGGSTIDAESLWAPITAWPDGDDDLSRVGLRGRQWLMGIGRLRDGVTIDQARAELSRIGRDLRREHPEVHRLDGFDVQPAGPIPVVGRAIVGRFVALLSAFVGLILLIACFNVAGMLLTRGAGRAEEIGVRLALGATRPRVIRLLLVESLIVALGGAVVGLAAAWAAIRVLEASLPALRFELAFGMGVDARVAAFALIVAVVTGVAFGLAPARAATRLDVAAAIVRGSGGSPRRLRLRSAFVMAQLALSALLVVCALLLGRSLRHAGAIEPGFDLDRVEAAGVNFRLAGYSLERAQTLADTLLARIEQNPAVEAAALARVPPLTGEREGGRFSLPDRVGDASVIDGSQNIVTPGYFRTVGLSFVEGRNFTAADRGGASGVAIVNETLARMAWPGQPPLGKRFMLGSGRWPVEVVGVVRDAKYRTIGERATPFFYVPLTQRPESMLWILTRPTRGSAAAEVRAAVQALDPNLPIIHQGSLAELSAFTLFPQRVAAWLAAIVGVTGILLAALGVYGITTYEAGERRREIGIRVALGAPQRQVIGGIVRGSMRLAVVGVVIGLVAASFVAGLLEGLLYGVRPLDPLSFVTAGAIVLGLALAASVIPAARAVAASPLDALRRP